MATLIVFDEYGGPEVLYPIDVPDPMPGPGQVRVRIRAAGVQPFDCLFRSGAAHRWMPATFPQTLGNEFAGTIDAVGDDVTGFAAGDEVLGWDMLACYADQAGGRSQGRSSPSRPDMPWEQAGVLSASGQTASTALTELDVGGGDTVLVHAAAGGVGSFAVQIARSRGATVVGTASQRNHEYLRSLGATPVAYGDGLTDRVRAAAPGGVTRSARRRRHAGGPARLARAGRRRGPRRYHGLPARGPGARRTPNQHGSLRGPARRAHRPLRREANYASPPGHIRSSRPPRRTARSRPATYAARSS